MTNSNRTIWQSIGQFFVIYGAWLVAIAILTLGFLLLRSAITQWYVALELLPRAKTLTDRAFVYIGGAVWIFFIFYCEGYLRDGGKRGDIRQRIERVFMRTGLFAIVSALLLSGVTVYLWLGG